MRIDNSRVQDVEMLKDKLRKSDVDEIFASTGDTPYQSLDAGLRMSPYCKTIFKDYKPIGMFGLVPLSENHACVWGLGTDDINTVKKSFYKLTKVALEEMLTLFPVLFNYVDCRNKTSIRWLKALGAEFELAEPFGVGKLPFKRFHFRRKK